MHVRRFAGIHAAYRKLYPIHPKTEGAEPVPFKPFESDAATS